MNEMSYDQGGAEFAHTGKATKKALKEAIKEDPSMVYLYSTSAVVQGWSGQASELPEGMTFNVVGPDPYANRSWYASVKNNNGKVTVS